MSNKSVTPHIDTGELSSVELEKITNDYGWSVCFGLHESEPVTWKGRDYAGRDDLLKSLVLPIHRNYNSEQAEQIIRYLNSQMADKLDEPTLRKLINKRDYADRTAEQPIKRIFEPRDTANRTLKFSETDFNLPDMPSLKTGVKKIDDKFQFSPGFHLFVGSPGVGKSWFCTWLAKRFLQYSREKSVFFSLEMGENLIKKRLLQQWSGLSEEEFKAGADTSATQKLLQEDNLIINFFDKREPEEFIKLVGEFYGDGYRVFLLDHFHQLPGAKSDNKNASEVWGRTFEYLRNTYPDIYLIIFAQPNKASYKKVALQMNDINESAALIEKSDTFISLSFGKSRGDEEEITEEIDRERVVWVDKNRLSGSSGFGIKIYFGEDANYYPSKDMYEEEKSLIEAEQQDWRKAEQQELDNPFLQEGKAAECAVCGLSFSEESLPVHMSKYHPLPV